MSLRDLVRTVEGFEPLDGVADWLAPKVTAVVGAAPVKNLLSGTWLGHPLHPMLTDVTIGAWSSAALLDLTGGENSQSGADALIAIGLVSALPTAASGLSDWSDTVGGERRIGLVHAATNVGALALYAGSWALRRTGRRRLGIGVSLLAGGALSAGGYLGGHLAFARGIGVDHTVFDDPPAGWEVALPASEIPDATPVVATAGGYAVLLYRRDGVVHAIADRCTHAGGPLHEGEVDASLCVTCPWHGSSFRLSDGSVTRGPATAPQPSFDTRLRNGNIEVRARGAN